MKKIFLMVLILCFSTGIVEGSLNETEKEKAEYWFQKGMGFYQERNYSKASESWIKSLEYNSDNTNLKKLMDLPK